MSSILVVDDDDVTLGLLKEVLEREGHKIAVASSAEIALGLCEKETFPVILSDIQMVQMNGLAFLKKVKKLHPETAVILMTGFGSMEGAISAIQEGAFDYVSKPFQIKDLISRVARAMKHWESLGEIKETSIPTSYQLSARSLIGKSPKIVEVYKTLARAAMSSSTILITGESGTGKELVARAIHNNGQRRSQAFVAVNCGALAESLLESELFGHMKGAFTGALYDKRGLFESAHGGTLFLDEIGDISPSLQVKLLRIIQENQLMRVGASESITINVRLIAATHQDLEDLVRRGKFREDLYYRLKVISIELPPLRERMEDLPLLVDYFLVKYSGKNRKSLSHISEDAMSLLKNYSWPGNIRELEHAIERAVALTNTAILFPEDFPPEILRLSQSPGLDGSLEALERKHIEQVLNGVRYNKSKASEILGIDRATLYRKALKYGITLRVKP